MLFARLAVPAGLAVVLGACSPVLDWRRVEPAGGGLVALFPCKPERATRSIALADGAPVAVELLACRAGPDTWALASADLGDPGRVAATLEVLRRARSANLDGRETASANFVPRGATPHPGSLRLSIEGRLPDGARLREESMLFARGSQVFHAAVLGPAPAADAVQTFFDGLEL